MIYDVSGARVNEIVSGFQAAGNHQVSFDASRLSSGVYLARLNFGGMTMT